MFVWRIFYGVENLETSIVAGFFKIVKYIMLEYCIEIYIQYDGLDIIDVSGNLKICGKVFLYFIKYFIFFFVRFIMLKTDGKARFNYVPFTLSQINAAFDQIYAVKSS